MKLKVGSTQFSYRYGAQLHMPYTIAVLVSYLQSNETIKNNFTFLPTAVNREDFDKYIELYKDIDILLCSCYIWNWEITKEFTKKIKKFNPKCLVIFGGPQIPEVNENLFKIHSYVDLFVYNEGEVALTNIFLNYLQNKPYDGLKSVSTINHINWIPENIIKDINTIPSPYINNLIWELIDKNANVIWLGIMETVRGCPYACAYCAWGASSYSKIRKFDLNRVYKEIDFFSDNKLTYIDCSDANFGMLERDVQITDYLVNKKKTTGFPTSFKPCWDKKVNDRIKYIAKALKSVDLLVSVGCSLQTLHPEALTVNNRKSVSFKEFVDLTNHFKQDGSQCYTEIIRGLPGETLDSFIDGLNKVIFESEVDTVFIYNCSSYESTELHSKCFVDKYNVKTVHSPILLTHSSLDNNDIIEYDDLIISSYSFTTEDLNNMYIYSWYMLVFQFFGIIKYITRYINSSYNINNKFLYTKFVEYCKNNPDSLFGKEYINTKNHGMLGFTGKGWNHVDINLGPINWPIEEASFLRLIQNKQLLKINIIDFFKTVINIDDKILSLINFQLYTLSSKDNIEEYVVDNFEIDWKFYFTEKKLIEKNVKYSYKNKIPKFSNDFDWNTQCIWYGRRKVNYKAKLEEINIVQ